MCPVQLDHDFSYYFTLDCFVYLSSSTAYFSNCSSLKYSDIPSYNFLVFFYYFFSFFIHTSQDSLKKWVDKLSCEKYCALLGQFYHQIVGWYFLKTELFVFFFEFLFPMSWVVMVSLLSRRYPPLFLPSYFGVFRLVVSCVWWIVWITTLWKMRKNRLVINVVTVLIIIIKSKRRDNLKNKKFVWSIRGSLLTWQVRRELLHVKRGEIEAKQNTSSFSRGRRILQKMVKGMYVVKINTGEGNLAGETGI